MRRGSSLFVLLMLGSVRAVGAAEEPRALIELALKARGGDEAVEQHIAVRMKMKCEGYTEDGKTKTYYLRSETWQSDRRYKLVLQVGIGGPAAASFKSTIVMNDEKSWKSLDGKVTNLSKDELYAQKQLRHLDRVSNLTALLTDKGFTFAPLPDIKVDGRPARGIKVSYKGQPDTNLYFDKYSGLLVKYAYRQERLGEGKEALHETILSDYREPDLASADEKILRKAKMDVAGPALVTLLRQRTPSGATLERARAAIRKLGDDAFKVREQASADLVALGAIALPLLRAAAKKEDREVARRARECVQRIGEQSSKTQMRAAIHLLGLRKPAGAADVLLNYLVAGDADLANEVRASLFAVAHRDGKPDPTLVRALESKDSARRKAAEAALGKDGGVYAKQPGRRLFPRTHKMAMKHKSWVDGKLGLEVETSDYQFFNAFEDKVFAKP